MSNFIQTRTVIRALTLSTLLAATATAYATTPTPAGKAAVYDGNWSVVVITEKGTYDRPYR
jgi:invasion protein IalB